MFKALSPTGFFIVVMIYFLALLGITVISSNYDAQVGESNKVFFLVAQAFSVLLFFIIPAFLFALFFTQEKLHYFLLHKAPSALVVIVSCLLIITAMPFIGYLEGLNKSMTLPKSLSGLEQWMKASEEKVQQIEEAFMKNQTIGDLLLNLFVVAFLAALSGEFFFRGLIQRAMTNMTKNIHLSVWVTAILFSAFHMQFYGFLPRVLLGAILGYAFVWSGSLWTSIIAHFLNNALVLIYGYCLSAGYLPKAIDEIGMEGDKVTLAWALPSMLLVLAFMILLNKMKRPVQMIS